MQHVTRKCACCMCYLATCVYGAMSLLASVTAYTAVGYASRLNFALGVPGTASVPLPGPLDGNNAQPCDPRPDRCRLDP